MASRARTGAAALGFDARNAVADGRFHHGRAVLDVDGARLAGMVNKVDLGHGRSYFGRKNMSRRRKSGQSYNGSIRSALVWRLDQDRCRIAVIAACAAPTASLRSARACAGAWLSRIAASRASAVSATRNAPIARADPFSVCANAPASAGIAASAPARSPAWRANIPSTSRSRPTLPSVIRRRCSRSTGPSSAAGGGDGIDSIRFQRAVSRNPALSNSGAKTQSVSRTNRGERSWSVLRHRHNLALFLIKRRLNSRWPGIIRKATEALLQQPVNDE